MARSCVTDPRWRELVALYRYDWIAAADVLFGKTPTWQQDLIIESVQEQGSKTSVSSGHGTGKSDMTSIMIMLFIIMYPGARAIIVANKIQQVMTGIFKYIKINWATATSRFPWLADYFVLTETAFYEVTGKGVWTVVPKGFRLGSEEALAGEHADHLLYIIDEASGVSDRAFGIITGDRITASYCCHSLHAQAAISTILTINWPSVLVTLMAFIRRSRLTVRNHRW